MESANLSLRRAEWASFLTGEMLTLTLLGKAFFNFPQREWLQSLADEDVFAELPLEANHPDVTAGLELLRSWSAGHRDGMSDEQFQDLKVDYTRLFIGVDGVLAPPWESVHLSRERLLFQEQTIQVRHWYLRHGLEVIEQAREPDDHVGLELSFLGHLARLGIAALEADNEEEFNVLLDAQRGFMTEHMLRWLPLWSGQVSRHARTELFRGLGLLTRGVLHILAQHLDVKIPEKFAS